MSCAMRPALWLLAFSLWLRYPLALALSSALDVDQYSHTAWRVRDGFAGSHINAIAQTPDGFLWLGTERGLMRFDGVRTKPWRPPPGTALPDGRIRVLFVGRDGTLWIGGFRGGLSSWNHGRLTTYPELLGSAINGLAEDRQGSVWVGATTWSTRLGLLCAIPRRSTHCHPDGHGFGPFVGSVLEDHRGNLWVNSANGLWHWQPGAAQLYSPGEGIASGMQTLTETPLGDVLLLTVDGVRKPINGNLDGFWIPPSVKGSTLNAILSDRDGAIWIGTRDRGLIHVHDGRMDSLGLSGGLTGNDVVVMLEDREGDIWVVTDQGLDRFSELAATTYSARQGMAGPASSVLADRDGTIWFSTHAGLYHFSVPDLTTSRTRRRPPFQSSSHGPAQASLTSAVSIPGLPEPAASIFQDRRGRIWVGTISGLGYLEGNRFVSIAGTPRGYIDSIAEDRDGNLWIAHRDAGVLELSSDHLKRQIPWEMVSGNGHALRLAVDHEGYGLWLGFASGGVVHLTDGHVRAAYGVSDGLGSGQVNELRLAADGTLWVATEGGLSRMRAGQIQTLDVKEGLPCNNVDWSIENESSLWLYTACGLIRIALSDVQSWVASADHVGTPPFRVPRAILDYSDGVPTFFAMGTFSPHIAKTADGRLWFITEDGMTVVDPRHLAANNLPPPVDIEEATADRTSFDPFSPLHLPPLVHDLQIDYTALSLVAPEKVQFRYRLEGRDRNWRDVGARRQAFYSDLPPGNYRFHVIASNNSGVWNTQGATLDFSIAPAYWQTNWFRALCALVVLGLLWMAYMLRLRQLTSAFNMRLEARVSERTRIARELHDTLLQSFQGLLLRFQTVAAMLPKRPQEAKEVVLSAVDQAAQAITEGRRAVQGLRGQTDESGDFATDLRTAGELASRETGNESAILRVEVEGSPRTLHHLVRDEIYRIACEALRNAFRHAQARQIELELEYHDRELRLRVRDDGKGLDAKILEGDGQVGHFGLHGMRERAKLIDGQLEVWSAPAKGTEVDLRVPASRAYAAK